MQQSEPFSINWPELLDEFLKSKLTQAEFCRQKNISYANFNFKFRKAKVSNQPNKQKSASFAPVKIASGKSMSSAEILVILPNGFRCQIPPAISPDKLQQLVRALMAC